MPKISVIVPVYKVENYINRCIDSILNQTFSDFELILVDDGSPDNCGKICDDYARKNDSIIVIHKDNGGLSDARNKGIEWVFENSDSEWISFIDSDDWIHPDYLKSMINGAEKTGCDISICGYISTDDNNFVVNTTNLEAKVWNTEEFFCDRRTNAVVAWAKIYKRDLLKNIRYPVGKIHEDSFTTHKIIFQCEKISFVDEPLYAYFRNREGICRGKWTTAHLVDEEAINEQIEYFSSNGYFLAEKCARLYLIIYYADTIKHMLEADEDYSTLVRQFRIKMKRLLRNKKNYLPIPEKKKNIVYKNAYPKLYRIAKWIDKKYRNLKEVINL